MKPTHLASNMIANVDFLIIEKHPIDGLDSSFGGLGGLIVNIAITTRTTLLIGGYLAG